MICTPVCLLWMHKLIFSLESPLSCRIETVKPFHCSLISFLLHLFQILIERCFHLRKYATHLFTTPQSNVLSYNMMSKLILTLTKQVSENQYTRLCIKTYEQNARFKRDCILLRYVFQKKTCSNAVYFSRQRCFLSDVIFFI